MNVSHALLTAGVAAVLLVPGCGTDSPPPAASSPTITETTTVTGSPTDQPPGASIPSTQPGTQPPGTDVPTGSLPVSQAASADARLSVTGARVGEHPGYDRVVFDFAGTGTPGWTVRFTDDPRRDGSGEPVSIPGTSIIEVVLTGLGYPDDTGHPAFVGVVDGVGGLTRVDVGGVFEGQALAFIGTNATNPGVRVSALSSPTRLVVDIAR